MMREKLSANYNEALAAYSDVGVFVSCEPYGNGHINDTFLVVSNDGVTRKRYILQRINGFIFANPVEIMSNIVNVTAHIATKAASEGHDALRSTLTVVSSNSGSPYYEDSLGSFWRLYTFVEGTVSLEKIENPNDFYRCAKAFGHFQLMLSDFPAEKLYEAIPDFHNTPKRYKALENAVRADIYERTSYAGSEIEAYLGRRELSECLEKAHTEGKIPLRVTHNDTKLNNILFDEKTFEPICIIDLDTVMPGYSVNDFGDSIRFGANTAAEDEKDVSKVSLDLNLYELFVKGFLEECGESLTADEIKLLPYGAMVMTYECGARFLTDYLNGDTYFKTSYSEHNLIRCRTQLALVKDMESKLGDMQKIVESYK